MSLWCKRALLFSLGFPPTTTIKVVEFVVPFFRPSSPCEKQSYRACNMTHVKFLHEDGFYVGHERCVSGLWLTMMKWLNRYKNRFMCVYLHLMPLFYWTNCYWSCLDSGYLCDLPKIKLNKKHSRKSIMGKSNHPHSISIHLFSLEKKYNGEKSLTS